MFRAQTREQLQTRKLLRTRKQLQTRSRRKRTACMHETILLEARKIVKTFPGVRALDEVDFSLREGEVHALVGENGAGKSTLMLTLGGIYQPDSGSILMKGKKITCESPHDANLKGISIVFQELSLIPTLSIAENIFANRQPVGRINFINRRKMYEETQNLLKLFDLDCIDPATPIRELSIANQQVVEILKAISYNPSVLILDEPTSSLTEHEISQLFHNIRKLKARGLSFIYISHHLIEIFEIADRVTVLRDGKNVSEAAVKDIDEEYLITNMVGRTITNMYGKRGPEDAIGEVLFEARNITDRKKGLHRKFKGISFSVRAGEIVGVAGLIGAGRTEMARAIFGAELPESGTVFLKGKELNIRNPKNAIRAGIGYLSEDRKSQGLITGFTIKENAVSNHLEDFTNRYGMLNDTRMLEFAEKTRKDFRILTPSVHQLVRNLSGGNQQKVLLGTWFGINPEFLIVDEPTRGVDVGAKSEIYQLLRNLAATGVGILMISSDLTEILGLSDRILVMKSGKIVGTVPGEHATEEQIIAMAASTANGGTCE
jgi:ABC-type sugar transport system ATPase subunit